MSGRPIGLSMAVLAVVLLAGCNDDALGRPLHLTKGHYVGATDPGISADTDRALARRVLSQRDPVGLNQPLAPTSLPEEMAIPIDGRIAGQRF